jgi:hypothetical protein
VERVTLFSWGYDGRGSSTRALVAAAAAAERARRPRGFDAPFFVDVRLRRGVRAAGFRDGAFERRLGSSGYRWMPALGNAAIAQGGRMRLRDPSAVEELLDLALELAPERRRVLFFCSCPSPAAATTCHRALVATRALAAARRRGLPLDIVEWPGGEPDGTPLVLRVTDAELRGLAGKKNLPLPAARLPAALVGLPWGARVELRAPGRHQLVAAGPAQRRAGTWRLPLFLGADSDVEPARLLRAVRAERRRPGLERRRV